MATITGSRPSHAWTTLFGVVGFNVSGCLTVRLPGVLFALCMPLRSLLLAMAFAVSPLIRGPAAPAPTMARLAVAALDLLNKCMYLARFNTIKVYSMSEY